MFSHFWMKGTFLTFLTLTFVLIEAGFQNTTVPVIHTWNLWMGRSGAFKNGSSTTPMGTFFPGDTKFNKPWFHRCTPKILSSKSPYVVRYYLWNHLSMYLNINVNLAACCDWSLIPGEVTNISHILPKHYSQTLTKELWPFSLTWTRGTKGRSNGTSRILTVPHELICKSQWQIPLSHWQERVPCNVFIY